MPRRRKLNKNRAKDYLALIRKIRGRTLLEALHRLQNGLCAYDGEPCVLLLPQALTLYSRPRELIVYRPRFSTIDHVQPRHLGGLNVMKNFVMASQVRNGEKGCLEPVGRWVPSVRHTEADLQREINLIDSTRWLLAQKYAEDRRLNRQEIIDHIVSREIRRTSSSRNFKFYDECLAMVA